MRTNRQSFLKSPGRLNSLIGNGAKLFCKQCYTALVLMILAPITLLGQAPTFSSSPIISVGESDNYNYLIVTNDANNTISATTKPAWLTLSTELAASTFAGRVNAQNSLDGQGTAAEFHFPSRMAIDATDNNYILEHLTQTIRKVSPTGAVTTVGTFPGTQWITVGADNNIYATSGFNINRITPAGTITTFAGSSSSGHVDANGTSASFENPQAITADATGNLYVMDNFRLRKMTPSGDVSTLAGNGVSGYVNGVAAVVQFEHYNNAFFALTVDASGNIYVGEDGRIRKVTPAGDASLHSGTGSKSVTSYTDGTKQVATYSLIGDLTINSDGNLLVINSDRLRMVTMDGTATTLIGSTTGYVDAEGTGAKFSMAYGGITIDSKGSIYIVEDGNHLLRKLGKTLYGNSTGFVGTHDVVLNVNDGNGGSTDQSFTITVNNEAPVVANAIQSQTINFNAPFSLDASATFSDPGVNLTHTSTLSGGGNLPSWLSFDPQTVAFSGTPTNNDFGSIEILLTATDDYAAMATASFNLTVVPNAIQNQTTNDNVPFSLDASATFGDPTGAIFTHSATVSDGGSLPSWLSFDPQTVVFSGTPTTNDAGTIGIVLTATDNFAATVTAGFDITVIEVNFPPSFTSSPITEAAEGVVYSYEVTATDSNIEPVTISATTKPDWLTLTTETNISTLSGSTLGSTNGAANAGQYNSPNHMAVDAAGNTYIADAGNHQIRKITPAGVVSTLAGTTQGDAGGLGAVQFSFPAGIAVDAAGNVYVADRDNHKIKVIDPNGITNTFAGSTSGSADGQGTAAQFNKPLGLAFDASGNLFVADGGNNKIRKITPGGLVSTFAGSGDVGQAYDGIGTAAQFYNPSDIAIDYQGTIYVADWLVHKIRKIDPITAAVTTFAGPQSGLTVGYVDATGTAARFRSPYALDVDAIGNVYVADRDNYRIRKITPAGVVSTFAGAAQGDVDGNSSTALFNSPSGIAIDNDGNLLVADRDIHKIRKIVTRTTLSGDPVGQPGPHSVVLNASDGKAGSVDQSFTITVNNTPTVANAIPDQSIDQDAALSFTFAANTFSDANAGTSLTYTAELAAGGTLPSWLNFDGPTRTFSGTPTNSDVALLSITVIATDNYAATVSDQFDLAVVNVNDAPVFTGAAVTSVRVNETYNYVIGSNDLDGDVVTTSAPTLPSWLSLAPRNNVSTILGSPGPTGIDIDGAGNLIMIDRFEQTIVKITPEGLISILAGQFGGGTTNGTVAEALFNDPKDLTIDDFDNIYVAEANHRIRKITPAGDVTTFAGSTTPGSNDGTGESASFSSPQGLATDAAGNVYVSDGGNHSIRKITPQGVVTTIAGSTTAGFINDTGVLAQFNSPRGLEVDDAGNIYVADYNNHVIRKISLAGAVTTYAGSTQGFADGLNTTAQFNGPSGVDLDIYGNVFVAELNNYRVRKISSVGMVSTIAGSSGQGSSDGVGTAATFTGPEKIVVDTNGTIYVSDPNSGVARKINPSILTGDPTGQIGDHAVVLTLTDGNGGSTDQSFTITVLDIPTVDNIIPDQTTAEDALFSFAFAANTFSGSNPEDILTYTATLSDDSALPAWLNFDGASRTFSGTPTNAEVGNIDVKVTATDANLSTVTDAFQLTVRNTNDAPTFTSIAPTILAESQAYTYDISLSDVDGDVVTTTAANLPSWLTLNTNDIVSTLAGTSTAGLVDGSGASSEFSSPKGIAIDANDNVFVVDASNDVIRKITPAGVVSSYVGYTDESEIYEDLYQANGLTIDASGNLYVVNTGYREVLKITPDGFSSRLADPDGEGGGDGPGGDGCCPPPPGDGCCPPPPGDGPGGEPGGEVIIGETLSLMAPADVTIDGFGNIYISDAGANNIMMVTPDNVVTTIAGTMGGSAPGNLDGNGSSASFNQPAGIAADAGGNVYVADAGNHRIRMINTNNDVFTLAGDGAGYADGIGTAALFNSPTGITIDNNGDLLITDTGNNRIRKLVLATDEVTTVAGSTSGYAEGIGSAAQFNGPIGVAVNSAGKIIISDNGNNVIRKLESAQSLTGTSPGAAGTHNVVLNAADGNGGTADQSFTICVSNHAWTGATDTDWATASNWAGGSVPISTDDVMICEAINDPIIASAVEVGSIDIGAGGLLTISSNSLKVTNGTVIEGTMDVASESSFIPMGSVSGSGSAIINRNTTFGVTDGQYSVIGSPITAGNTSSLGGIIYSYDETVAYDPAGAGGSTRFLSVSTPETMLIGDAYFSANTGDISFTGIPNTGNINVPLVYDATRDEGAINAGFNLVSNPYTAAISYADFVTSGVNNDIDGTIYLWDDGGSSVATTLRTNSDYITVSSLGAAGGNLRAASWDGFIRSTQGFFVKATTAGTLNFAPSMMTAGNNSDAGFYRSAEPTVLRFSISSELGYNDILIGFIEGATTGMDRALDAQKIKGNSVVQFYSRMDESILAIQALPYSEDQTIVDLGFDVGEAGTYVLNIEDFGDFDSDILLLDRLLNKTIAIAELGSYTFTSEAIANSDRFSLIFNPNAILGLSGRSFSKGLTVFSDDQTISVRVDHILSDATINIYNVSGSLIRQINHVDFDGKDWSTDFSDSGVFILFIQSNNELLFKKFLK